MATYSNSKLVSYTKISPNKNSTRVHSVHNPKGVIDKITIHHMAGNLSIESCGAVFSNGGRQASSNYGIGTDGRVGMYVEEKHRAWTSCSPANDYRAVTIEVANDKGAPTWHVSDKAYNKLIELCVDICKRNGIKKLNFTGDAKGNLTMHKYFAATGCPGPYLESKFKEIADTVNKKLSGSTSTKTSKPKATKPVVSVLDFQKAAIADGYKFPKYGADGSWGAESEAVASKAIVKKRLIYTNKNLTKLVQKVVGVSQDGLCGKGTKLAIEKWQKSVGLTADGIIGLKSWKKILNV